MLSSRLFHTSGVMLRISNTQFRVIPKPTEQIPDVNTFLSKIGRKCDEFTDKFENKWENLFGWDSRILKDKGIPVSQRKYILLQVEKLRKNEPVHEIKLGKKSFFGGERKRKETIAKWRAEQRNSK
ncbi:mitochondrial 37S ribosomal protein mS41 Ecym_3203 [Eremothecium cymbalariae DBVPG|uniref:Small ribosomal subunit protein mS41 n=1 Tax=Eremothecium cymbalariae (strain CBS 270.75 / DBVPG 7215 / KCTC 17166 / NRRL Y-17582) TaxID=931890 RepID=G8JRD3_ERECY|nr:Hypothetical protein Ecym_3203 [Eremothecium cymbalariae DBVPG\